MSEWQPIENAPKNWIEVLVWKPEEKDRSPPYPARVSIDYQGGGFWRRSAGTQQPTHWMPLPNPPEGAT